MDQHRLTTLEIYKIIQFDLYDFINLFNSLLCNRCSRTHTQPQQIRNNLDFVWVLDNRVNEKFKELGLMFEIQPDFGCKYLHVHHDFYLKKYLFPYQINKEMIEKWFLDIEHGYFHGLMTGFMAYFFMKYVSHKEKYSQYMYQFPSYKPERRVFLENKTDCFSELFFSCLLHDFARMKETKNHALELKEIFPNLLEETYYHNNPPEKYNENLLILADRTELRRYNDFNNWKNSKFLDFEEKLSENQKTYLNIFYDIVRPALEYLYENRNSLFIRHGLEDSFINVYKDETIYPLFYHKHLAKDFKDELFEDNFAIEIDKFPFLYCSNHSEDAIWTYIKGFISLNKVNPRFGYWVAGDNEDKHLIHFDHLVARFNSNMHDWTFTHRIETMLNPEHIKNEHGYHLRNEDLQFLIDRKMKLLLETNINSLDNNIFNIEKYLKIFTKD